MRRERGKKFYSKYLRMIYSRFKLAMLERLTKKFDKAKQCLLREFNISAPAITNNDMAMFTHLLLAVASYQLMKSGYESSSIQEFISSDFNMATIGGAGKMATGAINMVRNPWQIWKFYNSKPEGHDKTQIFSSSVSAMSNVPQVIGGAFTNIYDTAAGAVAFSVNSLRVFNYHARLKGITSSFNVYAEKAPGLMVIGRGALQSVTEPVAGGFQLLAGAFMFYEDLVSSRDNTDKNIPLPEPDLSSHGSLKASPV